MGGPTVAQYIDFISKLSVYFRADPSRAAISGYDPMNEWHDMDPAGGEATPYAQNLLKSIYQGVFNALRAAGDNTKIHVEGLHYSGAWDWVANNAVWALALTDPANNYVFHVHCYLDNDSSGTNFAYDVEAAKPGAAPPGLPTGPNIGPERMAAVVAWAAANSKLLVLGETGWGNDDPTPNNPAALDNFAGWNAAGAAMLAYCQANNIETYVWGAGPGFPLSYSYCPEPMDLATGGKNFTATGFQSTQMSVLEQFSGYAGARANTYRIELPFANGQTTLYGTPGTAMGTAGFPFRAKFNGTLTSPVIITPKATLADGTTVAAGSFSPATVTLGPGTNVVADFTFTPTNAATMLIGATNNAGLTDPPLQAISSINDVYHQIGSGFSPIFSTRREYTPYVGPALNLIRDSDNAQQDFYFNNVGNLPRQAIQDWASSRSVRVVVQYDQSGAGNHAYWSAGRGYPVLTLVNGAGYPEITFPTGAQAGMSFYFNVLGASQMTMMARVSPNGIDQFVREDYPNSPFRFSLASFGVQDERSGGTGYNQHADQTAPTGSYHSYTGTFKGNTSDGLRIFLDGTMSSSVATTGLANLHSQGDYGNDTYAQFGWFKYYGASHFEGAVQSLRASSQIALSASQQATFIASDTSYYGTALPDSLTAVAPTISGATTMPTILTGRTGHPFASISVADTNTGSPTDSATITLTQGTGTLSGTGLSGTGPYTVAAATAASLTSTLQALSFTTTDASGSVDKLTLAVTSSAGTSASAVVSINIGAPAAAETPFAAPAGTFTPVTLGGYFKGVNLAGGEQNFFSTNAYGVDYVYPRPVEINEWASQGFNIIRMPINNRRVQPSSYGALDAPTYSNPTDGHTGEMKKALDAALAVGMYVILDTHDYGQIYDTLGGVTRNIGADSEGTAQFVDYWQRLATKFKNYPNIIWGLMNEPSHQSAADWKTGAVAAINAIAAITTSRMLLIPGVGYTNADQWTSNGNSTAWAGYVPPAGLSIMFEMHQYLDSDDSGTHETVVTGKGATVLASATSWARTNGFKVLLGEFAWSYNDTQSSGGTPSVEGTALMDYMSSNNDVWGGWTYWNGGTSLFYSNQPLSCVPHGYDSGPFTQAAQEPILVSHLAVGTHPAPPVHASHLHIAVNGSNPGSCINAPNGSAFVLPVGGHASIEMLVANIPTPTTNDNDYVCDWDVSTTTSNSSFLLTHSHSNGKLTFAWIDSGGTYVVSTTNNAIDLSGSTPQWVKVEWGTGSDIVISIGATRTSYAAQAITVNAARTGNGGNTPSALGYGYSIGARAGGTGAPGDYSRVIFTMNGTVVSDVDFSTAYVGDTSVADAQSRTFNTYQTANFVA